MKTKPFPRCAVCNFSIIESVAVFLDGKDYHPRCHVNRENPDWYTVSGHVVEIEYMDHAQGDNIYRVAFVPIDSQDQHDEVHLFLRPGEAWKLAHKLLELT